MLKRSEVRLVARERKKVRDRPLQTDWGERENLAPPYHKRKQVKPRR